MKNLFKILAIAIFVLAVGYYIGLRNRSVNVLVHITTPSGQETGTQNLHFKGNQLSNGVLTDLFGSNIKIHQENIPWYVTRSSAIVAYILMFLVVVWGTAMTTGFVYRFVDPPIAWGIHKFFSIAMATLVFFHIAALLFDKFMSFGLAEILIPFTSKFKPGFVTLGIIGFYILLLIMISSIFFRNRSERVWHYIHLLVYPLFLIALVHGLYTGTDSKTFFMTLVYRITGVIFAMVTIYRFSIYYLKPKV